MPIVARTDGRGVTVIDGRFVRNGREVIIIDGRFEEIRPMTPGQERRARERLRDAAMSLRYECLRRPTRARHTRSKARGRAPIRRTTPSVTASTGAGPGDDGPSSDDPPKRRAGQQEAHASVGATILAILVDQRTAGLLLGWTARRFIGFVRRKHVPHAVDRRLIIAKLDDVLAALGLTAPPAAKFVEPAGAWQDRALRLIGGGQ